MYRVVIADDESLIRKGLRETVEWDSLGLEISGEANNGIEALRVIKATSPHILITDIKMPEMDGIELIEEIRNLGISVKIIVLSGYSDYTFLRDAIRLGVESYLLKPIDNDELISNLFGLVKSIEKEIYEVIQQHQGAMLLRSNILNRLVTNGISQSEFSEKASFLGFSLDVGIYLCAVCAVADTVGGSFYDNEQMAVFAVNNICEELSRNTGMSFIDAKGRVVLLLYGNTHDELRSIADEILRRAATQIPEYLGFSIMSGAGLAVNAPGDIWKSYDSAVKCLDYCVITGDNTIIWHDANNTLDLHSGCKPNINYELIETYFKLGKKSELLEYIDDIFNSLSCANTVSADYVMNLVMRLSVSIVGAFRELTENETEAVPIAGFKYSELLKFNSVDDFRKWIVFLCEKMFTLSGALQKKGGKMVNFVVSYIEEHYFKGLNLKQVADVCQINTSYLGQIFKKEMGESFTDYINKYRIQKAKRLLLDSTLKVYEIAEKVGFTDYHYFLKIFKKITGVNPTEIRNLSNPE